MKIIYISHRFENNICASMHLNAIREIITDDELYVVNLGQEDTRNHGIHYFKANPFNKVEKVSRILQNTTWFLTNKRIKEICNLIKEEHIERVFIDESILGKLVKRIKLDCPNVKVVTFYHDIAQVLYPLWFKNKGLAFFPEMVAGIIGEKENKKYADVNLVLNDRDAKLYKHYFKKNPEGIMPMVVADPNFMEVIAKEFDFENNPGCLKNVLFVGTIYKPNVDGLKWFVENVFSMLDEQYRLIVIGRGLEKIRKEYQAYNRVEIIGEVDCLASYYNNADIVVAPVFSGGGMKQKTAEAFAYGRTFIGTTESLQGYESELGLQDNGMKIVFLCDTPEHQLEAFKYIEDNAVYGYHKQLNDHYNLFYSKQKLKIDLKYWLD